MTIQLEMRIRISKAGKDWVFSICKPFRLCEDARHLYAEFACARMWKEWWGHGTATVRDREICKLASAVDPFRKSPDKNDLLNHRDSRSGIIGISERSVVKSLICQLWYHSLLSRQAYISNTDALLGQSELQSIELIKKNGWISAVQASSVQCYAYFREISLKA